MDHVVPEAEVTSAIRANRDHISKRERVHILIQHRSACALCGAGPKDGHRLGICLISEQKTPICYVCAAGLQIDPRTLNRFGPDIAGTRPQPPGDRLLNRLTKGPKRFRDLQRAMHADKGTLDAILSALVAEGKVIVQGDGSGRSISLK